MKRYSQISASTPLRLSVALTLIFISVAVGWLRADPPSWWSDYGVTIPSSPQQDFAVANQGQLKNVATRAYQMLLNTPNVGIGSTDPGGTGEALQALIAGFQDANNYAAVNQGQLKAVAKPFYDRLKELNYTQSYPWEGATNPPNHFALANIGQVKALFAFDPALNTDGDLLPDYYEKFWFNGSLARDGTGNNDGDAFSDAEEFLFGLNPNVDDSVTSAADLSYDALGRLQTAGGVTYSYDAEGNIETAAN